MEQYLPYLWLAVIVIAAIVEGATAQLVSIWLVAGGVGALIATMLGAPFWAQVLVFLIVTLATLAATRPFVKRMKNFKKEDTNAGRYVDKDGVVIAEINNTLGVGQVKVLGSIWTARAQDGEIIPFGANIHVISLEGVKLTVKQI